tara:strand:+ start:342 stop:1118 length:777 start_codon:yes stop_codon:yes gene_type:complete
MLKILHKRPWFITNNNSYRFTDTNVWESTQKDFTFYVEFQMDEINTGDTHCIFCRPGKHMGVFAKNRNMFTWDFWDVIDGKSNFNDISFYVGKENLYKRYVMIISHDSISKRFKAKLTCLDDDKTFSKEIDYIGGLHDYSDTPFNFGIANYEHDLTDEHKAICQYTLWRAGLFDKLYTFQRIEDFLERNKDVKRNLVKPLANSIFLINTNELTKYKAYDNSGNCFNLEINIGLIKKIYDVEPWRTLDVNILGDEKTFI